MADPKKTSLPGTVSPSQAPFRFMALLELPFPISVDVNQVYEIVYDDNGSVTELEITILHRALKVVTGNNWDFRQQVNKWTNQTIVDPETYPNSPRTEYTTEVEIGGLLEELKQDPSTSYIHIESVPAIVCASCEVPEQKVPSQAFDAFDLMPKIGFFTGEVLPSLQKVIAAYRMAALPSMRYSISPVSEAIVEKAHVIVRDYEDTVVLRLNYGFDVRTPSTAMAIANNASKEIQARFDELIDDLDERQPEDQMAIAYSLYRMRRWAEAVTIASSVVDGLQKLLVEHLASTPIEAEAIWKAYGTRYRNLYKEVFPAFKLSDLSKQHCEIWSDFTAGKEFRGTKVHGGLSRSFDKAQEADVKRYLKAFHEVCQWLSSQLEREWALDFYLQEERADPFP